MQRSPVYTERFRVSESGAKGWKAYLGCGDFDDTPEIVVLCLGCAAGEFGAGAQE